MNGALVRLTENLPTQGAWGFCSCTPACTRYLWGRDVALRDLRGQLHSLTCAVSKGDATWKEIQDEGFEELPLVTPELEEPRGRKRKRKRR